MCSPVNSLRIFRTSKRIPLGGLFLFAGLFFKLGGEFSPVRGEHVHTSRQHKRINNSVFKCRPYTKINKCFQKIQCNVFSMKKKQKCIKKCIYVKPFKHIMIRQRSSYSACRKCVDSEHAGMGGMPLFTISIE